MRVLHTIVRPRLYGHTDQAYMPHNGPIKLLVYVSELNLSITISGV